MSDQRQSDLVRASGLWLKDGAKGKYMAGKVEQEIPAGAKLLIFKNDRKERDNQPDYQLFFCHDPAAAPGNAKPSSRPDQKAPPPPEPDDIPF